MAEPTDVQPVNDAPVPSRALIRSEDWLAVVLGCLILAVALLASYSGRATNREEVLTQISKSEAELSELKASPESSTKDGKKKVKEKEKAVEGVTGKLFINPLKPYFAEVGEWKSNPGDAFYRNGKSILPGLVGSLVGCLLIFALGSALNGKSIMAFVPAFVVIFGLAVISYVLAGQTVIKYYNLEYALWALLIGMIICNTIGTPAFLKPAMQTELYIKTGLVLLGAEILLSRLLALGLPGICVSWVVTPVVLITTYLFGQYVLRIPSRSLNMVICADMSVCGVSAAIATGAACRAKKEELSLAIGLSLAFTVIMMVVMPGVIRAVGMSDVLAGAWLGGTIDSTGAVAAAGGMVNQTALEVAMTVKMIQNILIGVVAFGVAVYWVTYVERSETGQRPSLNEIWLRFPKFVIGFVGASIVFSIIYSNGLDGRVLAESAISGTGKILRGWFFCLAFVSIGLETNFREISQYMKGGKPLTLYVCGQALNLALSLLMSWIMFEKVFPQVGNALSK